MRTLFVWGAADTHHTRMATNNMCPISKCNVGCVLADSVHAHVGTIEVSAYSALPGPQGGIDFPVRHEPLNGSGPYRSASTQLVPL